VNQKFVTTLKNHKKGTNHDKEVRFAIKGSQESRIFLAARKKLVKKFTGRGRC
jgi:hypothetical protein